MNDDADFSPSALGTKEHWDAVYSRELKIFHEYGYEGEIWFGEGSVARVVRWLNEQKVPLTSSIVDIGTGNAMLLVVLAKSGYSNLLGIDYCSDAIKLARGICEKEGVSPSITLQATDFLGSFDPKEQFDIALDKGTFDAVSMDPSDSKRKRQQYKKSLCRILKPNGIFIITSCNWTKDELVQQFGKKFEVTDELPTPSFSYGGSSGCSVTALVFRRKT